MPSMAAESCINCGAITLCIVNVLGLQQKFISAKIGNLWYLLISGTMLFNVPLLLQTFKGIVTFMSYKK